MPPEHALIEAIKNGEKEAAVEVLSEDPGAAYATSSDGVSALLLTAYYHQTDIGQNILAARGENAADVFEAAALGLTDRLRDLAAEGEAITDVWSPDGFDPLQLACYFGKTDAAIALLDAGADVNSRSKNGLSVQPLHAALAGTHLHLAVELIDRGASVKEAAGSGWTVLHYAAGLGDEELVRLVLAEGAPRDVRNSDGKSPSDLAEEKGHLVIAELLRPPD